MKCDNLKNGLIVLVECIILLDETTLTIISKSKELLGYPFGDGMIVRTMESICCFSGIHERHDLGYRLIESLPLTADEVFHPGGLVVQVGLAAQLGSCAVAVDFAQ